jgi:hypothetical protein
MKKLEDLPPLADLSDWESLRVQLNLPAVDDEDVRGELADIEALPVARVPVADEETDNFDDGGLEELVATRWPNPARGSAQVVAGEEPKDAQDPFVTEDADASASSG